MQNTSFDFIKMNKEVSGLGIIGQLNKTMTLDEFSEYAKTAQYTERTIFNMIVQLRSSYHRWFRYRI